MVEHIPLSHAKAHFSALIERIEAGEEFIITKMGKPVAKVATIEPTTPHKRLWGLYKNHDFKIADDFDEWPEEEARALGIID